MPPKNDASCLVHYFPSEGRQRQMSHFEMLFAEGYANDCDVECHPEPYVGQRNPNASHKKPDDIHHSAQTPWLVLLFHHPCAKRPQAQRCQLDALQAKRDANDCHHHRYARHHIFQGCCQSTEQKPNYIA